jgi:hypothetical protein
MLILVALFSNHCYPVFTVEVEAANEEPEMNATAEMIDTIKARAFTLAAREMEQRGVNLTHEQADEIGQEGVDWLGSRLGLRCESTHRELQFSRADGEAQS